MDFSLFLLNAFASEAINCLNAAIDIYTDMVRPALLERPWGGALRQLMVNWDVTAVFPPQGRFTIAAKHHITIAEIYETELVDIEKVRRWGKLVGGDPRCPCGGDTRAEGSTSVLLQSFAGGVPWRPWVAAGVKPLARAPGCLCSDLGQRLHKTEHRGQQAHIREEWLVLLVVDAELRGPFIPCLLPPRTAVTLASCFTSPLASGAWSCLLLTPLPWLLAPLPWGLGSHPLPALTPVILAAHIASQHEVLCLAAARPRQQ